MTATMTVSVKVLAELVHGELVGDSDLVIDGVESLDKAGPTEITFAADLANLKKLPHSRAGAVIVSRSSVDVISKGELPRTKILVEDAQAAFLQVLDHMRPPRRRPMIGISSQAVVSATAQIGTNTNVYPGAYIGDDAMIGEHCDLYPGVVIGPGCRLGDHVTLHPHVVLYHDIRIGNHVIIHAGSIIGADGFGYRLIDGRHRKIPHFGTVRIEDEVEIGACTIVDRAMIGATVIGEGTKLDNLVVIAHNCEIGRHNAFVSQVGLAGSVTTGDYVVCAGQVGIADHVHLGEGCVLGAKAGVHKDIPAGQTYLGSPAQPVAEAAKTLMTQRKLPELRKTVRELEAKVAELTARLEAITDHDSRSSSAA